MSMRSIVDEYNIDAILAGSVKEADKLERLGNSLKCTILRPNSEGEHSISRLVVGDIDGVKDVQDVEDVLFDVDDNTRPVIWLFDKLLAVIGIKHMCPAGIAKDAYVDLLRTPKHVDVCKYKRMIFIDKNGYVNFNMKRLLIGKDGVLNVYDPWPVFVLHCVQIPHLLIASVANAMKHKYNL